MDKSFVWIIPDDMQRTISSKGVSAQYLVPAAMLNVDSSSIINCKIWLVTRGLHDILSGVIYARRVEKFIDGINKGDYLLTVDLKRSFKIVDRIENWKDFTTNLLIDNQKGMSEISSVTNNMLIDFLKSKIQTKIGRPNVSHRNILKDYNISNKQLLLRLSLQEILQNFSFDEVWASKTGVNLSPFSNFVYELLKIEFGSNLADELIDSIRLIDPIVTISKKTDENALVESTRNRLVDLDFTPIDPEKIYAREFIASDKSVLDIESSLAKTQVSEKIHQEMLRDITSYLLAKGIMPLESSSVDLVFEHNGQLFVYEIKSTNSENLISQCSKGAFQLAYYGDAISKEIGKAKLSLVIHKTSNYQQELDCLRVLSKISTDCLVYDPQKDWPERLVGFLQG